VKWNEATSFSKKNHDKNKVTSSKENLIKDLEIDNQINKQEPSK
jgi:hypothetical protein